IATGVSDDSIKNLGLELEGLSKEPKNIEIKEILKPKVGIYKSWVANMDEGWTRWVMDKYNVDLDTLHNNNIQKDNLSKYNVIIIPSQSPQEILNGYSNQDMPEEFTGGIGIEGSNA